MKWDSIGAIATIITLILTVFMDWPQIKARYREAFVENKKFQQLLNIISIVLVIVGVILMLIHITPYNKIVTGQKASALFLLGSLFWGLGGMRTGFLERKNILIAIFLILTILSAIGLTSTLLSLK